VRFADPALLASCVHCGLCLPACPTYLEDGLEADSPRGRIHLLRALEEGRIEPDRDVRRHLDACLGCRACETACPSGVRYGALIEAARPWLEAHRPRAARLARRALGAVLASDRVAAAAFLPLRWLGGRGWAARLARRAPGEALRGWLALAAAGPGAARAPALPERLEPAGTPRGTAVLLTGCAPARLFPATAVAAARLLVRAGVRVVVPRATGCCGALALHLGDPASARRAARARLDLLAAPGVDWVVTTAAGCGALLHEYDRLVGDDARAARVAGRARDALALLATLGLPPAPRPLAARVAVHDPCHLAHGQGVRVAVRELLGAVPGVRLVPLAESDTCCGSAGTYNLTEPAMARRLLARKMARVEESGADVVAAANPGCLLQMRAGAIARGLAVRVAHPLDLLAAAHGA
jgi:glycolate oxidase iron-sulfur subunit